jgi:hypothetical protein
MLPRQGIRRSYCSTVAIPALVTYTDTGLVLPSVAGMSAPLDKTSNFCAIRMRQDALALAGLLDNVAEPCDVRCSANGLDVMLHWNAERQRTPIR